MQIRRIYDPVLRQPAHPVTVFDAELKKLAGTMLETMHSHRGMGLAANQLGLDTDLLVLEYRPEKSDKEFRAIAPLALCNAKVIKSSQEKDTMHEGCLSVPGLELPVKRASGVTVEAQDLDGKPITIKARGLLARILQHEIDHLDGILFTDRADGLKELKNYTWARVVFFGSDDFSLTILRSLLESGLNVYAVITNPDRPAGRGGTLTSTPVKTYALANNIAVFTPNNKDEITDILQQIQPELGVLASFGMILPEVATAMPLYGILNVHPSLLPQYRGATPLQSVLLDGQTETGVTIMKLDAGVDTGTIVRQQSLAVTDTETLESLKSKTAKLGAKLLLESIPLYVAGQAEPKIQSGVGSKTIKLTKEMGEINWNEPSKVIERKIRALNPWPGTYTFLGAKRLKVLSAHMDDNRLALDQVQLEGKSPCSWADFVRGYTQELKNTSWFSKLT